MRARHEERKAEIFAEVEGLIRAKLTAADAERATAFMRVYYRDIAPADLIHREALDLYGTVLAHFRFAEIRQPNEIKIRVYNPSLEQHGWESTHTIIEIVNDDMPFLVDSVSNELIRQNLGVHLVIHPVFKVARDAAGRVQPGGAEGGSPESLIHAEIDRLSGDARLAEIEQSLRRVLTDVRHAVADWRPMCDKVAVAIDDIANAAGHVAPAELDEARAFLEWMADNHFTFLGYSRYQVEGEGDDIQLRRLKGGGLGILRGKDDGARSQSFAAMPLVARLRARSPSPVVGATKAHTRSTVHRASYLDYVGVKIYAPDGSVTGENRFLGLFTSAAYNRSPRSIPLLRRKIDGVIERAGYSPSGHIGKALVNLLETYPRDELFQASEDELHDITTQILYLQERQQIRLFLRRDAYERFVVCLVYVPRERYNTALRQRLQTILEQALDSNQTEFQVQLSESALARLMFTIRTPDGIAGELDVESIERNLVSAAQGWSDKLKQALLDNAGEEDGNRLFAEFGRAFPLSYQESSPARGAVPDILAMDAQRRHKRALSMSLYRRLEDTPDLVRFKLIRADEPIHLSDALPILENMGLRVLHEEPHLLKLASGSDFAIHDFGMRPVDGRHVDVEALRGEFQNVFDRVWNRQAENDGFNRLVLYGGLSANSIEILRAYSKYLMQVGIQFSQSYIEETLCSNPALAGDLAELFAARFDPDRDEGRAEAMAELEQQIEAGLEHVAILDEDRIIRTFLGLIRATTRTNAYQPAADGSKKNYLSLKFDPSKVPGMPLPKPAFEIFVYAPDVEGVHLRGGKVARGGLRWSDRREDFRTEVLGLMKAQMVKNSVIVPVGAKGGFFVKRPPAGGDRQAQINEAIRCYKIFLSGLLDITDNQVQAQIVPPAAVVRHDDDDPYLVVAADKGTATFSDIANGVSADYGFWLGDAFASGGSAGYDHKGMGITAKGAWESVKRHFREMGVDTQSDPFTVVGIGDMSGDVFGNGMLLSDKIRLLAAFDHRHIFLDPDPDPASSFAERQRLFDLPRSSWDDYDRSLISPGGGVFARALKSIPLSAQAAAALGTEPGDVAPLDLLHRILKAPVDLWWNGGIGTYVKAKSESHADAQDRANDAIRVNGIDLRCKVVGEGGNLGCTQRGRIEFAMKGGRVNTDFIDNSAGVDCSDHEVNIKILLGDVVANGDMTRKQRDELLREMTDEVSDLCLRDNILQNLALSMTGALGGSVLDAQIRMMRKLELAGRLDREIEILPSDELLEARRREDQSLTRPEAAVLLAYAKTTLYSDLLQTALPDRDSFVGDLAKYFPRPLRRRFASELERHRLRREIVATWLANSVVNRGLDVFVSELEDETGSTLSEIAMAYVVTRDSFGLLPIWNEVEQLGVEVGAAHQVNVLNDARATLMRGTRWFLANLAHPLSIRESVAAYAPAIAEVQDALEDVLAESQRAELLASGNRHSDVGIASGLARRIAAMPYLLSACDIVAVARLSGEDHRDGRLRAARIYFALADVLHLSWLRARLNGTVIHSRWERMALSGLEDKLGRALQILTQRALTAGVAADTAAVEDWASRALPGLERYNTLRREIESAAHVDQAMLSVAVSMLDKLGPPQ